MFEVNVNGRKQKYRSKPTMNVDTTGSSGGSVQPDWNQNDSTAADYIKNRPFYTGDPVETGFVEESTVSFSEYGGALYSAQIQSNFEATVGQTYKVTWDGNAYECTCVDLGGPYIGNLSIIGGGSDTGEPFVMMVINGAEIRIGTKETSASHTISISGLVPEVVKIDEKYLPTGDDSPYELKEVGTKKVYVAEFHVESSSDTAEKLYNQVNTAYSNGYYVLLYYYAYNSGNNPRIYSLSKSYQGTFYFSHFETYNDVLSIEVITLYPSGGQYKMDLDRYEPYYTNKKANAPSSLYLKSSVSQKLFEIKVDDSGTISATEVI